ncbi:MAG: glycine cleavage system aminomethyltransferase GcvT [Bacteroidota bacterium]
METRNIALNDLHIKLGGKMVPFAGFNMPVRYSSDIEEHKCVREKVGVFDVSHMGEFFVSGAGALALIQKVTSNDAAKLEVGQAQYSCFPNETGGIVDDLIVYKLAEEEYMLVVNASNIEKDWAWISRYQTDDVMLVNASDRYSLFAVQGPESVRTLQKITNVNLEDIKYYTFAKGSIGGVDEVIISATGYTGERGFELYVPNEDAETLWHEIFKAGDEYGIMPIGLGARDTLRLEMGYCLYGNDINDETSPLEAGLGWITKFSKEFVNSENLQKQKEAGLEKRLVGFELVDKGIPRLGYEIFNEDEELIGQVTSGTMSPSMSKGIGMGYVKFGQHKAGTTIKIAVRKRMLNATIVKMPILKK